MSLYQTRQLLEKYGEGLKNNTISDKQLDELLSAYNSPFKKSAGFVDINSPISDKNFSQSQGINDFVLCLGSMMDPDTFHKLTGRIISRAPDRGTNTFMRNSTLEKVMLAFELNHNPESAASHFNLPRIQEAFPGKNDIGNLKKVILQPIVDFFDEHARFQDPKQLEFFIQIQSTIETYPWVIGFGGGVTVNLPTGPQTVPTHVAELYAVCQKVNASEIDKQFKAANDIIQNRDKPKTSVEMSKFFFKSGDYFSLFSRTSSTETFYKQIAEKLSDYKKQASIIDNEEHTVDEADNSLGTGL